MSAPKTSPPFVFVDNLTERLIMLRRPIKGEAIKGQPTAQESTMVGRGLNYVRADYVEANLDLDTFGMALVDPCKIAEHDVDRVLHRCTSRQAIVAWGKLEKRPKVLASIKARLNRATPSAEIDETAEA